MIKQILKFLPFLLLLAVIPFILPGGRLGSYYLTLMILSLSYATAALGLTVLLGYSGQISLAQAAFFGIGAYIFSILAVPIQPALLAGRRSRLGGDCRLRLHPRRDFAPPC